jgi:Holliday junction resolvase RusA-like endonuclease
LDLNIYGPCDAGMSGGKSLKQYHINIEPKGCVRMTRKGKFINKYALNYLSFKKALQYQWKSQHAGDLLTGPLQVDIIFMMPIPKNGRSQKRKVAAGEYQTTKPDVDNLVKSVFDAANQIIWEDDNQVCKMSAQKVYSDEPAIWMEVKQL